MAATDADREPRFVVRDGPPTWIIWDNTADRQVNSWPYVNQSEAAQQAERLNHMRFREQ